MDKFWKSIEECSEPGNEVEMFQVLFFGSFNTLGHIRKEFDSWSIDEMEELLMLSQDTYTVDDGVDEELYFGHRWEYSSFPLLEARFNEWCATAMWKKTRPSKKRFF